jgi:stearoyl-CoA desaturase (delta-9 desaturase)
MRQEGSRLFEYFHDRFRLDSFRDNPKWAGRTGIMPGVAVYITLLHLLVFGFILVGWSPFALVFALGFYLIRMFGITAFYHRYFSHRAFVANRFFSCLFAILGCTALQKGPLWWSAIHRHHHLYADTEKDIHSPKIRGFFWSHIGWSMAYENMNVRSEYIKDWIKFPELVFIEKFWFAFPLLSAGLVFLTGHLLALFAPALQTNGPQLFIWGFVISTFLCSHAVFSINSIDHMYGSRRYDNPDTSRNNLLMALLTLGEGWHNNHHHYAITAHAGFYWWEIDITYYMLVVLSWFRIVRNLRPLPLEMREKNKLIKRR